jgi:nitroreductase
MLRELIRKNRSYRRFDQKVPVPFPTLLQMADAARLCPSGANRQPLKYLLVDKQEQVAKLFALTKWGAMLPNYSGPAEGERPTAFVVICCDTTITPNPAACQTDVGIVAQTMALTAVEQGYGCCMIGNFKKEEVASLFALPENLVPQLLVAVGKPAEEILLDEPEEKAESVVYYRDMDGVHHVPKRPLREIVL